VREFAVGVDRLPDPADISGVEDAASQSTASDVALDRSSLLFLQFFLLLPGQDQQLGVGGQHLANGVLKLSARRYPLVYIFNHLFGDVLGLLLSSYHEGVSPDRVTRIASFGAVTGRVPAANTAYRKRAGEKVIRDGEAAEQSKLSLPETRG